MGVCVNVTCTGRCEDCGYFQTGTNATYSSPTNTIDNTGSVGCCPDGCSGRTATAEKEKYEVPEFLVFPSYPKYKKVNLLYVRINPVIKAKWDKRVTLMNFVTRIKTRS